MVARSYRSLVALVGLGAVFAALLAAPPAVAPAEAEVLDGTIHSSGPLTSIATSRDLNCAVNHVQDAHPEFFGGSACGTFVAVGGVLYGPSFIPSGPSSQTPWTPVSQIASGTGTSINPYRVTTVVKGGPLRLSQTDSYVVGDEAYATRITVENASDTPQDFTLYRAADCYLQNSDRGYGRSDREAGSVACVSGPEPTARIEQWAPLTPGSQFYEASYSDVWRAVASGRPFPNTSADTAYTDNGAGLSWTSTIVPSATIAYAHLTAFSPRGITEVSDNDGDSLPDAWESPDGGVDTDGDGVVDLKLSDFGATPDKKDVFVQVNWTKTRECAVARFWCSTRNRRPSLAALRDVQAAFARHGVRLHVDAGPESLMNPDTGATWGRRSHVRDGVEAPSVLAGWSERSGMDWTVAYDHLRLRVTQIDRARIFHQAFYVGRFDGGTSGIARVAAAGLAGRDFIVAIDAVKDADGDERRNEAGTFMHELGHNLGLSHGGRPEDRYLNWKPNYPSVMNYWWQMTGVPNASRIDRRRLDYSAGTLSDLDENALTESDGLGPDSSATSYGTQWACPDGTNHPIVPAWRNVDWNCDGAISTSWTTQNVTGVLVADADGQERSDTDLSVLRDHDDWSNLLFDGGGALGGAGVPTSVPDFTPATENVTADDLLAITAGDPTDVDVQTPGQIVMQSGTTAPVDVTLVNPRDASVVVALSVVTDGVTIDGIPTTITLSPRETRRVPVAVRAGTVTDAAFFEVAAEADDGDGSGSASTEVYVVDRPVAGQPGLAPGGSEPSLVQAPQVVSLPVITNLARPTISGKARVGKRLTVSRGRWSAPPQRYAYRWYRDGKVVGKRRTYVLRPADRGHRMSVKVVAKRDGWTSGSATSSKTKKVRARRR